MNKDIQTLIEREACEHWSHSSYKEVAEKAHSGNDMCKTSVMARKVSNSSFQAGASFALSLFKWRKVSEFLPEKGKLKLDINNPCLILAKKQDGQPFTFGLFADIDIAESFEFYGIVEWMPIPQID